MMYTDIPIDGSRAQDITENPYYKKLQKELKDKNKVQTEKQVERDTQVQKHAEESEQAIQERNKKVSKEFNIKDEVILNAYSWEESFNTKEEEDAEIEVKQKKEELKHDAKKISRHMGFAIDFEQRKTELKEMFKFNLVQSRSHNMFTAKFAQFKVGVVGQILSMIGIPIDELKKLKQTALKEAFEENLENMSENIYNTELAELMHGKTRQNKNTRRLFEEAQTQLIQRMNGIGRPGYWSKSRVIEEKITQCKKIIDECEKEKSHLSYQIEFMVQGEIDG